MASCSDADTSCDAEPAYGGNATDEVWVTMADARARALEGADASASTVPKDGDVFNADGAPPTLVWQSPLKLSPTTAWNAPRVPQVSRGIMARALSILAHAVIPPAHAHLAPVSSDAYLVDIASSNERCLVSIVTTDTSHALDAEQWARLTERAGEDLALTITSAYLANGRITEGPFRSESASFRVE